MEFPHLVQMHRAYAKDGLVCVSLNIDEPGDRERALTFLKRQEATIDNFLIDEPSEVWQKKLDAAMPPAVLVIGRDGKRFKNFGDNVFTHTEVEIAVREALKAK